MPANVTPERREAHDWAAETYVDEWVRRQQAEDPSRAERDCFWKDLGRALIGGYAQMILVAVLFFTANGGGAWPS